MLQSTSTLLNLTEEQNKKIVDTLFSKLRSNMSSEDATDLINLFLQYDSDLKTSQYFDDFSVVIRGETTVC